MKADGPAPHLIVLLSLIGAALAFIAAVKAGVLTP